MRLETAEILEMSALRKADLFADAARQMIERRYEATIALAALQRSHGYVEAGFRVVEELAATRSELGPWEVSDMLWVGCRLLDLPELEEPFRDGVLGWSEVRALAPHADEPLPSLLERFEQLANGLRWRLATRV